ncbi:hypothetical protein ACFFLM_13635 [Deinococcus oregonensis]|uniref:Uncharacterized protein n=1 Tax=Deinococcus oregonensis TaxID=1805970 RepID=A0ABV6AZZ9_9DEIO
MTRARAPLNLKLSREMKILLILLLMVALIGGWYVWTSTRSANVIASSGTGTTGTGGTGNGNDNGGTVPIEGAPAGGNTGTAGTGTTTPDGTVVGNTAVGTNAGETPAQNNVAPDGTVTIPTLPPLGNDDGTLVGPNGEGTTVATPAPGGINPDTPLVLLPGVNPFRPLSVKADLNAAGGTTPTGSVTATANTNPSSGNTNTTPTNTGTLGNSGLDPLGTNGGAVAISPIPGSGDTVSGDSVDVTGGAFPIPTIPGADGASTSGSDTPGGVTITPGVPTTLPDTVTANNGGAGSNGTGSTGTTTSGTNPSSNTDAGNAGTNDNGTAVTPVEPPLPPIKPPVAGVSVPGVSRVPSLTTNANTGSTATTSGTDATGTSVTAALPTTAPRPGTPQVITELTPLSTGTPAETTRPLDQNIAARELAFNAVVLGPVNTAIFRSKDGFLVVSVGQTLPDSDIVIKEVTATSATLALGNDTQTLELDKR